MRINPNVSFFKIIFTSILFLIIFLSLKDKTFFVKADYFGKYSDAYYCKFIPAIGIFLGKQIDNSIQYDSSLLKGLDRIFINSHDIRSLADIYIGNPHRKNVALNLAGPPGRQVILGFWGYNYAQHDVNVKKIFIPLDIKEQNNSISDLTRILQFETNKNSLLKNLNVSYRVLGKTYTRTGKYFVINKNILFKNNVFYKGIAIGQAQIKPAISVIRQVTECNIDSNGQQHAYLTYKIKNLESVKQKISINNKKYILAPKVTRSVTLENAVLSGETAFKPLEIKFSILNTYKQCINIKTNSGLDSKPETKNLMVLRDDLSYNTTWHGIQPGFSVPYIDRFKVLCVTRIPYSFYYKSLGCKFVPLVNLSMKMNTNCIDFSNWRKLVVRIKNNGILLRNLKLRIYASVGSGNEFKKVEYYYNGNIYRNNLEININSIKAFKSKDIESKIRLMDDLLTSHGITLKAQVIRDRVIHGVTSAAIPIRLCKKQAKLVQQISGCIKANNFRFNQKIILTGDPIKRLLDSQIKIKLKHIVGNKELDKVQLVLAKSQYLLSNKKVNAECYIHNKEISCNLLQDSGYYLFPGVLELWVNGIAKDSTSDIDLVSQASAEFFGGNINSSTRMLVFGCSTGFKYIKDVKPVTPDNSHKYKVGNIKGLSGKNAFNYFFDFDNLKTTSTLNSNSKTNNSAFVNKVAVIEPLYNLINSKKELANPVIFMFTKIIAVVIGFFLKKWQLSHIIKYFYIEGVLTILFILFLGIQQIILELNKKPHLLYIRRNFNAKPRFKNIKSLRKNSKGV